MKEGTLTVLVTGSRRWVDAHRMEEAMRHFVPSTENLRVVLVHGAAQGADTMSEHVARRVGWSAVRRFPADWERFGKSAGFVRNADMLAHAKPDLVLGFKSSTEFDPALRRGGTEHMLRLAAEANVVTYIVTESSCRRVQVGSVAILSQEAN